MTNSKRCLKSIGKEPTKTRACICVSVALKGQGFELSHDKSKTKTWLSGFQAPLGGLQITRMPTIFAMGYIFINIFFYVSSVLCVQLHNFNFLTISVLPVKSKCPESKKKKNIKEMKRKDKNTKKERNESLVLLAKREKSKRQSAFDRRQKDQTNTQHQTHKSGFESNVSRTHLGHISPQNQSRIFYIKQMKPIIKISSHCF